NQPERHGGPVYPGLHVRPPPRTISHSPLLTVQDGSSLTTGAPPPGMGWRFHWGTCRVPDVLVRHQPSPEAATPWHDFTPSGRLPQRPSHRAVATPTGSGSRAPLPGARPYP